MIVRVKAPINIAIIKYWGKRDEDDIIPMNDSISVTLDMEKIFTETTVSVVDGTGQVSFTLNGKQSEISNRMRKVISKFHEWSHFDITIKSTNSFPTAAGMASSASGMAALVCALNGAIAGMSLDDNQLSMLARLGSGSACRSIHGGFVKWRDTHAVQLFPENHWPELRCIILIVASEEKKTSSRDGMQRTVKTSELYKQRLECVDKRVEALESAIKRKSFEEFATICMTESNQLHAVCLDSFPPIHYLNDRSFAIIDKIHELNSSCTIAAYTFDAGPNAFIFTLEPHVNIITEAFKEYTQIVCKVGGKPITTLSND